MPDSTLLLWAEHLRSLAAAPAETPGWTPVIPPGFDAWRRGTAVDPNLAPPGGNIDEALWRLLVSGASDHAALRKLAGDPGRSGPIIADRDGASLEVWTERELSALHALHWLARDNLAPWADRVDAAIRWHINETQPDNATNRPWALHLFLMYGEREQLPEARLYAETLLSNAQVAAGRPDTLSAMILADAADALDPK